MIVNFRQIFQLQIVSQNENRKKCVIKKSELNFERLKRYVIPQLTRISERVWLIVVKLFAQRKWG
jgi:hypothetical protein